MKKLIAVLLALALALACSASLAADPDIPAENPCMTEESPASIDILATAVPGTAVAERVMYFTMTWTLENPVFYRCMPYTWDTENLRYVRTGEEPVWTCRKSDGLVAMTVRNMSNTALTVDQTWTADGEAAELCSADTCEYTYGGIVRMLHTGGVTLESAAAGFDEKGSPQTVTLLTGIDTVYSVGETLPADALTDGKVKIGTVTCTVCAADGDEM